MIKEYILKLANKKEIASKIISLIRVFLKLRVRAKRNSFNLI